MATLFSTQLCFCGNFRVFVLAVVCLPRGGRDYELVVRSRFDLLLPEPLNLSRASAVATASIASQAKVSSPIPASSGGARANHSNTLGAV
jgi:hypothetical protein